jgi:hypothetical protein
LGFGVLGLRFGVWSFGFKVLGLRFGVWSFGFKVWGLGFGVLGFRFQVLGFGFWHWSLEGELKRVLRLGLRVQGSGVRI